LELFIPAFGEVEWLPVGFVLLCYVSFWVLGFKFGRDVLVPMEKVEKAHTHFRSTDAQIEFVVSSTQNINIFSAFHHQDGG
jgi:hypothetical protein